MRFENFLNEGVYDPAIFKAFFLAGGPGSGKSFVVNKTTLGHGLKIINSDTDFEFIMKKLKKEMDFSKYTDEEEKEREEIRNKAKTFTQKRKENYITGRLGLVIDGTGRNYGNIEKQKKILSNLGYDTYMIFVNTTLKTAFERNNSRERVLRPSFVEQAWKSVQSNIGKFQNLFGQQNFILIDNNSNNDDVFNKVWKQVMKYVNKPIKNTIAKKWIESELEKRKRS